MTMIINFHYEADWLMMLKPRFHYETKHKTCPHSQNITFKFVKLENRWSHYFSYSQLRYSQGKNVRGTGFSFFLFIVKSDEIRKAWFLSGNASCQKCTFLCFILGLWNQKLCRWNWTIFQVLLMQGEV